MPGTIEWVASHRGELDQARDLLAGLIYAAVSRPPQLGLTNGNAADLTTVHAYVSGLASPGTISTGPGDVAPWPRRDPAAIRTGDLAALVGTLRVLLAGGGELAIPAVTGTAIKNVITVLRGIGG